MNEKKITKRDRFASLLKMAEVKADPEMVKFIAHEIELLDKKNASTKPTATQMANEAIKNAIESYMAAEPDRLFTITEMCKAFPELADFTNQRVTSLVTQMKKDGRVTKVTDKRKSYFRYPKPGDMVESGE